MIKTVAIVGAGTMGAGIAQAFAQAGHTVRLFDEHPSALDRARSTIEQSLDKFVKKGTITDADRVQTLERVHPARSLDALADADYVVEAIIEDLEAKGTIFVALDRILRPDVILASNTSSISISALAAKTSRPDRVLGMHFMNPVPMMALVELVRGRATSAETMATATALVYALGKTPVEAADQPGFIANRILMPMINEAIFALADKIGTAEGIDTVMTLGMRHPMGPLALADLIGLDVCLATMDVMYRGLGDAKYRPCPLLRRMVAAGQLGRKSGQGFFEY